MTEPEYLAAQEKVKEAKDLRQDIEAIREAVRHLGDAKSRLSIVVGKDYVDRSILLPSPEVLAEIRKLLLSDQVRQLESQQAKFNQLEIP